MPAVMFHEEGSRVAIPVPDDFFTQEMPEANGNFVKVYLYLYRCFYRRIPDMSTAAAAKALHMLESDVLQALSYWVRRGLVALEQTSDQLWITFTEKPATPPDGGAKEKPDQANMPEPAAKVIRVERKPTYSPEEMEIYQKNPTIQKLFKSAESLMGEPLGSSNLMVLFSFYDYYRLPVDVILYLMSYCIEHDRRDFRYMEKVAMDWSDHGIQTVEQAREYTARFQIYYPIFKALHTSFHVPTEEETQAVDRWLYTYHLSTDLILEAAERTFAKIRKPSFKYMDGILKTWYQQQVRTLDDVRHQDEAYEQKKTGTGTMTQRPRSGAFFAASSENYYDYSTYEQLSEAEESTSGDDHDQ